MGSRSVLSIVGLTVVCLVGASAGPVAYAQAPDGDPFEVLDDHGAPDPSQPWIGWYGPFGDGLLGLRFGMDRFVALRLMRDRGLDSRPAREGELRFEGEFLGETAEVGLEFTRTRFDDAGDPIDDGIANGQLRRIQVTWQLLGLPHKPLRLFERLDGLLAARYGTPVLEEDDGFTALDVGDGLVRKVYFGREVRAQVELRAYRPKRYYLVLALENPQLTGEPE